MRHNPASLIAVTFLVMLSNLASAQSPPATIEDARAACAAGDYRGALRGTSALLASAKRDSPERYDLLMLKGECLMGLKQRGPAAEAFESAAAAMKARRDLPRAASATAVAVLVKASADFKYAPKTSSASSGIDVVDPSSRREAMTALYEDLKARLEPEVQKALKDDSLVSTDKRLRDFWSLYAVEFAAKGEAESTAATLREIGAHARTLIGPELERLTGRLEQLKDMASEPVWAGGVISYRGLHTPERNEVRQMADYLVQIQRTVENARRISEALGGAVETWDALLADCAVARDAAQEAYDRRY